ncbi:SDR family NAD(P)-dependent oxidoreductase [Agrobacterium vitis]|uniref:type I polyketide synthase n=1 Tax=Agrobacterium vitis TaxID=373 RepID=UPI0012E98C93|nr:type I polyketide synthase [Agrobacterium vitis]MUZ84731.1 SDR family NAD(P)-dependent oxidoreductase [Agrobacterium vitis]MVA12357.1 SDR family NAD(P)-dependent oxidoreductase [Agrobacterium vitis]NSY13675.1 SDR family NAD(P)-dependent oxidoreductase [Agrobacterium vitis]NSY23431.1 SDR family NAD(P)-dependent oxidoreductase [Agrobacterium vitis]NTA23134.1 SDR family NAD(P)-dependent oxidoreductase [Agrobacterium vitis]
MTVEIIGRACAAPGATSPEELFDLLRSGACTVSTLPGDRWDIARYWHPEIGTPGKYYTFAAGVMDGIYQFDPALFGMSRREAAFMDPQQRILLELTWRALEDANIPANSLSGQNVAVYVGASSFDHANLAAEDPAGPGPHFMTGNTLSVVSNRISHVFGLNGPSMTVDTACSSSLVALDHAVRAIASGEVDTAIVAGVNVLVHPLPFVGFAQARMLSIDGLCKAYANDGIGYVRSEGGAVLVLRSSEKARREGDRSHATIVASGTNAAGRTNGISLPSREAQAVLLRAVYDGNGLDPDRLAFIEGHGTGTKVGDPAEVWSLGTVIGQRRKEPVWIGSIKTNIGHTEPASGLLGVMKAMMALQHDLLPASLHFNEPNDTIDFDGLNVRVASQAVALARDGLPRLAGINSFGFGGANAHVVIADPQISDLAPDLASGAANPAGAGRLFMASAHSQDSLKALLDSYDKAFAAADSDGDLEDLISAAASNRAPLRHRFVASGSADAIVKAVRERLATAKTGGEIGEASSRNGKLAFVFSGNGAQWAGMGLDAYRANARFRESYERIAALFTAHSALDLVAALTDPDLEVRLKDTRLAQPMLFAIQASLSDALQTAGLVPDAVYGHSVGEVAAAYVSGALSLKDAVCVIAKRSQHQAVLAGEGTMAALKLGEADARAMLAELGFDDLTIAAINAPNSVTVSGREDAIRALREHARKQRVPAQVLDIDYPFHHPLIDKAKAAFSADPPLITPRQTTLPFISTVTGEQLEGIALTSDYWWKNVRQPVQFQGATEAAIALGCSVFVEISPRAILGGYVSETAQHVSSTVAVSASLSREALDETVDPVARALARAVASGAKVDEAKVFGPRRADIVLPGVPFERADLRPEPTSDRVDLYGRFDQSAYRLSGWRVDLNGGHWKNHLDAHLFPDLAEHVVDGRAILPGSGFVEIAISAAQAHFGSDQLEISNVEILRPLELSESRIVELSTLISSATGDLQIRSRERLSDDDWTVNAVARVRKLTASELDDAVDFDLSSPTSELDKSAAYRTARNFGLDYGPRFQLLEKAICHGERLVEVFLKPAAAPGHPLLRYNLNPMSVDAMFHGLVALFGRFSGEQGGAPYIPVRFGRVRTRVLGVAVHRAVIEIERISDSSIKANFHLFGETGERIATLSDSRFRRTYLKQHKTLDGLAYHYETIAVPLVKDPGAALVAPLGDVFACQERDLDNATVLIHACVLSAFYALAERLAGQDRRVSLVDLPGDVRLRRFLANALHSLTDSGFAQYADCIWTLEDGSDLPPAFELIRELYRDFPERTVELVMINDVLTAVNAALDQPAGAVDDGLDWNGVISEATLDHFAVHSTLATERHGVLLKAVIDCLSTLDADAPPLVVELGASSLHLSRKLADLVRAAGGNLVIFEPEAGLRRNLELSFEADPRVTVVDAKGLDQLSLLKAPVDLIASAHADLGRLLDGDMLARLSHGVLASARRLVAVQPAPDLFNDFAFGLLEGWFDRTVSEEFPLGRIGGSEDWTKSLQQAGFAAVHARQLQTDGGSLIVAEAQGRTDVPEPESGSRQDNGSVDEVAARGPVIIVHEKTADIARLSAAARALGGSQVSLLCLSGSFETDRPMLADALGKAGPALGGMVWLMPDTDAAADGSLLLQDRVGALSALAMALGDVAASAPDAVRRLPVTLVLPGGAPVTGVTGKDLTRSSHAGPVNAGLWAFARVLRNEFDLFDMQVVDTGPSSNTLEIMLDWGMRLLADKGENREWLVEPETGRMAEIRAVPGPAPLTAQRTDSFEAAVIRQQVPSQVASIRWESCPVPAIGPTEVLVKTAATGLNFRDVMWAMGLLPEEALEDGFAGASIGMEFAGEVVAVGSKVSDLIVGDKVMAIAAAAFGTHVKVERAGVAKLPDGVDPVSAATIPVVFLTAYYAIHELGRVRPGETILIHGAAGGVGLAALQVARHFGAKIIATAGTVEKRRFLETLGADHVFDSRSLGFVGDVLDVTGGEGVDLVLNSLFGEAMEKSLSLVKPFGRFLELGKRDYYADSKIGLRPFRRNVSYFGIDADQLLVLHPDLSRRMLAEIGGLFEQGVFTPLPFRAFEHDEIGDAFRLMQNAGHIGKIVVLPPVAGRDRVAVKSARRMSVDADGMHLVVGGIGGFGLAAADWLVEQGARHIALSTRRGLVDAETQTVVDRWAKQGVTAYIRGCDVTSEAALSALLTELRAIAPLKTVIHAAMVLDDAFVSNLTRARNQPVIDVKAKGAALLDRLTRQDGIDNFILFSSITTYVGNPGQGNYVAANGFLEGLARARRTEGLAGLAIGFGAIGDAGYLARNAQVNERLGRRIGKTALDARDALSAVGRYIAADTGSVDAAVAMISEFDWAAAHSLAVVNEPLFSLIMRRSNQHVGSGEGGEIDLVALIDGKAPAAAQDVLFSVLAGEIADTLRVPKESIGLNSVLKDIGLDSLMAVELGMNFEQNTGFDIPLSSLADNATVGDLTRRLYEKVSLRGRTGDKDEATPEDSKIMDDLHRRHSGQGQ